ncbi:hypothetical protein [Pseudoramibacter faecis]|uniref:hypothetical protein n=1 Tax=Pseudoramibacter faecis TaxID=3108534 RepID=UPI002E77F553|nr:hypothetical protein [Pseudoramibacter sp. HA2172]
MIFVILLVCVLVFGIMIKEKRSQRSADYDERQMALQDRAYRHAFFVVMIFCACHFLLVSAAGPYLSDGGSSLIGIFLGVLVYGGECIWNDAYFPFRQKGRRIIWLWGVLTSVNLAVLIVRRIHRADWIRDGVLTLDQMTPLVMVIVFGGFLVVSLAKWFVSRKENAD